jgi:hypothetical protein
MSNGSIQKCDRPIDLARELLPDVPGILQATPTGNVARNDWGAAIAVKHFVGMTGRWAGRLRPP